MGKLGNKFRTIYRSDGGLTKVIIGIVIALAGIALGAWLGLWVMLVGGIMDFVHVIKGDGGAIEVLKGVLKVTFSWIGWVIVWLGISLGAIVATD